MPGLSCSIWESSPANSNSELWHVGSSSLTTDQTWALGTCSLHHWTSREVPIYSSSPTNHTYWFRARLQGNNKNETRSWGPGKGKQRSSPGVCLCRGSAVGARCCPDEPRTGHFECSCGESAALPSIPRPFVCVWLSPHKQPQWNWHPEYEAKSRSYSIL